MNLYLYQITLLAYLIDIVIVNIDCSLSFVKSTVNEKGGMF